MLHVFSYKDGAICFLVKDEAESYPPCGRHGMTEISMREVRKREQDIEGAKILRDMLPFLIKPETRTEYAREVYRLVSGHELPESQDIETSARKRPKCPDCNSEAIELIKDKKGMWHMKCLSCGFTHLADVSLIQEREQNDNQENGEM